MANYNLTNQTISSSFETLLQVDSGSALRDGTGSLVDNINVTSSYATTASYAENVVDPTWDNITDKPSGLVSGSSQVDYPLISNIPSGIVSSSEQLPSGLVSGSSQVVLEDTTYTDNGDDSFLMTDGAGNLSFQYVQSVYETIRNMSDAPLAKGTPVYISGSTGDNGNAYPSIASDPLTMPATYVAGEDLGIGETGLALVSGKVEGVDTSGFIAGTMIYVGEGGGYSDQRPSGSNSVVQLLGVVQKEGVGGQGVLINQLEATLPNIQEGYAWVGDSNNQPQPIPTSSFGGVIDTGSFATTGSNTFTGDQIINGVSTQNFTAPANSNENAIVNMSGASIGGRPYNRTFFGVADYSQFGLNLEDYFAIEYYDSFGYNFGSEFDINGKQIQLLTDASGSGQRSYVRTTDNYDGTSQVSIGSANKIAINGNVVVTGDQIISGGLEVFDGPFTITQTTQQDNILSLGQDGRFELQWPNGEFYKMQNGAVQFGSNGGIGMAFDFPGIDFRNPNGGVGQRLSLSNNPGSFNSLNQSPYTGSLRGLFYNQTSNNDSPTIPVIGVNDSSSFDNTAYIGMNLNVAGNQTVNGVSTQNFTAPTSGQENAFVNVSGAEVTGTPYNRVFFGMADYPGFGTQFNDYFAIEYYDSFGYNFGSEFDINGKATTLKTIASGSGMTSGFRTLDNGDETSTAIMAGGTSTISLSNGIAITGSGAQEGYITQNFDAPASGQEIAFNNVSSAVVQGRNYNRVFQGMADYPAFGKQFEDYFSIEYYDSFGYNFGSEFAINGSGTTLQTVPSGSGYNGRATITTVDNYDGTADINLNARNGKVNVSSALSLTAQDPLPSGNVGDLAVSGSALYFYDGTWRTVSLV